MLRELFADRELKVHIRKILESKRNSLTAKVVIDVPAGSGVSSQILTQMGAKVYPFDLFPENFKIPGIECQFADLENGLSFPSASADYVLFQEGIEHIPNQLKVIRDLSSCLVPGGQMLLTTPNYSNMRSRLSYFLNESEYFKYMPPNEIESIWFTSNHSERLYMGHVFMLGIQKLRLFSKLSGLKIVKIYSTKYSLSAFLLMVFFYPALLVSNSYAFLRALKKNKNVANCVQVFKEQFILGLDPKILCSSHLIVELEKLKDHELQRPLHSGKLNQEMQGVADFIS